MARLEKNVLGEIRGRIGDIVVKVRNGKQYVASRPAKYTMSKAPHEVDKRSRFKVNGLFAKAVKESDLLYRVWDKNKAPATSAYNKICKVNFKLCRPDRPSVENIITPAGFRLPVENIAYLPDKIIAELESFDIHTDEKRVFFIMMICFYEPFKKESGFFTMRRIAGYDLDELKLTFNFNTADKQIASAYKKRLAFLAAVTQGEAENILRWSGTVSQEL